MGAKGRIAIALGAVFVLGCGSRADPGALVRVSMHSRVGVLLDEVPAALRERAARAVRDQDRAFWQRRARLQIEHTYSRLVYRGFFYEGSDKRQLPLPPPEAWSITLDPAGPQRRTIDGRDLITMDYALQSTLLSDAGSPARAEPALAEVGGVWEEPFVLPIDPLLLFQRTGYACMDEEGNPHGSVFEGNARWYYNQECAVEDPQAPACHQTAPETVTESCVEALDRVVGKVETAVRFERLAWDRALAERARVGQPRTPDAADLEPLAQALGNHWLVYRYIPPDSCALVEQCVGGAGWRRLLLFDASAVNVGGADLHIGEVGVDAEGRGSALLAHNVFEYSACHDHYHFRFYGDFRYGAGDAAQGNKQAFCLQTTQRYFNNEATSLTTPYDSCKYQGISAGWGDDYLAGLDCQWIDVTDLDIPAGAVTEPLQFEMNPAGFLCEGTPVLDESGAQVFEETRFTTDKGEPIWRPVCDVAQGWAQNNLAARPVTIPAQSSFINQPCEQGELGPRRDCGFGAQQSMVSCTPGETVRLQCRTAAGAPQVVRFCETSAKLGTGVACTYRDAVHNAIVGPEPTEMTFACPAQRDGKAQSGAYAMYAAPVLTADASSAVTCTALAGGP